VARGDLLIGLVRAARQGDHASVQRTAEALIAEEREKQHHVLADRLQEALRSNGRQSRDAAEPQPPLPGVQTLTPKTQLSDLLLPRSILGACSELIEEQARAELLRSYGLEPRHRLLLTGPPGNGKTSLAEGIAEALLVPLLRVRYEGVVTSFLGETASRLRKVFEFARTRHCVLFFDEFEVLAKERGDEHELGEIKRVVSSLLLEIDDLPSHVVVVAASNHPELLDRAAARRFQIRLRLDPPNPAARREWFDRFSRDVNEPVKRTSDAMAKATAGASFADLEQLTLDIKRQRVLQPEEPLDRLISHRLRAWKDLA
jgi:SpoVK/Ycf46/Vps4 family AAA+-type ATPase